MKLKTVKITICEACLRGEGDECHTPGCALYLHSVDLPISLYELISEFEVDEDRETDHTSVKPMSPENAAIYHGNIDGDFNY